MKAFPMFIRDLCDMTTPAIVDRDRLVVAIGSEGTSPVLTRDIKTRLEQILPQNIGALAGRLRRSVNARVPRDAWVQGQERKAARAIKTAIEAGGPPEITATGHISLVGAGPGARDLLTLRAVERLQEADVIFYDRLVDEDVLELARRDAERVFVGKHVGAHSWPQDRINQIIVAEAAKGKRVVRLKSGDPGIFGRATEEIDAANAASIPIELVPGVTAATAAGAALGQSLTQRDVSDALIFATASGCDTDPLPDVTRLSAPGTTMAVYMGVRHAARMASALMDKGLPADASVDIAAEVSKPGQRLLKATLETLPQIIEAAGLRGCAVIMITWPKTDIARELQPRTLPIDGRHVAGRAMTI
ncbi:uroporphyrinogen-III C-methyltransferase [Lutimaribacter marinistellae]|uniref:uroporphyrinogen-III C-methyltransferase n=1 Tax=Lutimaribacter marinistellae TaxID=1820329 RepID=A0ABV7TBE2_9RHOB